MDSFFENEILVVIFLSVLIMLLFAMAFIFFFYSSQRKFHEQQMEVQQQEIEFQNKLLFGSIQAQENERERIAREMHDEIGSKLNVINLGLHSISTGQNLDVVDELFTAVRSTLETAKQITYDLLPPTLANFGLIAALEELCERHHSSTTLKVNFETDNPDCNIKDYQISLALYRIAQELITNSFKHSQASRADLTLSVSSHSIVLRYKDNGIGFDMHANNFTPGLGLQNIESRVRMIGAEKNIFSETGEGVFVEIKKNLS